MNLLKSVLLFILIFSSKNIYAFTLVIDPGHGGSERGAVHQNTEESVVNMAFSLALKKELLKHNIKVLLTRESDKETSLESRVELSNKNKADLFLSIHANSHSSEKVRGLEIYFQNQLPPDKESLFLAHQEKLNKKDTVDWPIKKLSNTKKLEPEVKSILQDLQRIEKVKQNSQLSETFHKHIKTENQKTSIKQAPLYVVRNTHCPSLLLELGYLTNKKEVEKLGDKKYHEKLAKKITSAVLEFKRQSETSKAL